MILNDINKLKNNSRNAGYSGFMAILAGASIPAEHKNYIQESINSDMFISKMGEFIAEAINIDDFNANGERLQKEYKTNGFIKDIETGKALTIAESLQILRIYGMCKSVQDKSEFMLTSEAINPTDIQIKDIEETLKTETAELEAKLGKVPSEQVKKKAEELERLREELKSLKDKKEDMLEAKIKQVCDTLYQIIRIFNIANLTTKIVSGTVLTTLASNPFTTAYIAHPAVIAAIVIDIIWIIGPKNIPIIREMWELLETLIAKLGVQLHHIGEFMLNAIRSVVDKVSGNTKYSEAIYAIDPEELKARLERSNKIPQALKDVIEDNKDVNDIAGQIWKKITVDLKKDAIATDKERKEQEDEVTKIKTSITDDILKHMSEDPEEAAGLMGKLASDEIGTIPGTEPEGANAVPDAIPATEPTATGAVAADGADADNDGTDDSVEPAETELVKDPMDDTSDEEAEAEKQMEQIQESFIYKRKAAVAALFGAQPARETSYIQTIAECAMKAAVAATIAK